MDGWVVLLTKTICLSLPSKGENARIQKVRNNGKETIKVYHEPILYTNLDNRYCTYYKYRASSMVKHKNYLYCFDECLSHVLCKSKKDI